VVSQVKAKTEEDLLPKCKMSKKTFKYFHHFPQHFQNTRFHQSALISNVYDLSRLASLWFRCQRIKFTHVHHVTIKEPIIPKHGNSNSRIYRIHRTAKYVFSFDFVVSLSVYIVFFLHHGE